MEVIGSQVDLVQHKNKESDQNDRFLISWTKEQIRLDRSVDSQTVQWNWLGHDISGSKEWVRDKINRLGKVIFIFHIWTCLTRGVQPDRVYPIFGLAHPENRVENQFPLKRVPKIWNWFGNRFRVITHPKIDSWTSFVSRGPKHFFFPPNFYFYSHNHMTFFLLALSNMHGTPPLSFIFLTCFPPSPAPSRIV